VSYKGQPYPSERIEAVKYLVLDAAGNVLGKGEATAVGDGVYRIVLPGEITGMMVPGAYRVLTFALSKDVAMPATADSTFSATTLTAMLSDVQGRVEARIASLEQSVNSRLSDIEGRVASLSSSLNTATALAAVALMLALIALALGFIRKPKATSA